MYFLCYQKVTEKPLTNSQPVLKESVDEDVTKLVTHVLDKCTQELILEVRRVFIL